ncbi:ABC transporter substrate-binding protein [Agrococcus jenensis]|uniref:Thiamine pyrimidine synthase n=1 Tax=Agrococcus jenensis TaxID=46353 RepID=A0A3N2ATN9_9MICO|nr:ABC transporter substrate-binding protein [Agrococcus jenensis]ROR66391.1 NitT/TauT family transport system substrate-binding protein [Agrococcus jenensis]
MHRSAPPSASRSRRRAVLAAAAAVASAVLVACSTGAAPTESESAGADGELTPVTLQLQWFAQGQFAGYYAAVDQGFYEAAGLDVTITEGGADIVPQTVLADGGADFAIAWVPKALASREQGAMITDVAQIFQRSGTLQVSFADAGIDSVEDLAGKNVGSWGFGNEFELFAALTEAGLDPMTDVTLVQQAFDMSGLLAGDIDAAQAMTYNEYAQLLESVDPETGELYTADDFSVLDWNDVGTAMLQDAIWASSERLEDPEFEATTVAFIKASIEGWLYARDNPEEAAQIVVDAGSQLGASHQLWMVNETNSLIWPSEDGIGMIDEDAWEQTVDIAMSTRNQDGATVLTAAPDDGAWTNEYVEQALEQLEAEGVDVTGEDFAPIEVELQEGGQ